MNITNNNFNYAFFLEINMKYIKFLLPVLIFSACSIFSPEDNDISEADKALAEELWSEMTGYSDWNQHENWEGIKPSHDGTHGSHVQIWLNDSSLTSIQNQSSELSENSILVKEGYNNNTGSSLTGITVMKKIAGYNSNGGNWFWAKYKSNGSIENAGKISNCISCHSPGDDYIRFVDFQ